MIRNIFVSLILILGVSSQASEVVGNGGVSLHGKMLDLLEQGVANNPIIGDLEPDPVILARVKAAIPFALEADRIAAIKLTELDSYSRVLVLSLLHTMEQHNWVLTTTTLQHIGDENSPLHFNVHDLVQVAVRRTPTIYVNQAAFRALDNTNQAALILHEIFYALIKPIGNPSFQASWLVRAAVGPLFTQKYSAPAQIFLGDLVTLFPVIPNNMSLPLSISDSSGNFVLQKTLQLYAHDGDRSVSFDSNDGDNNVENEIAKACTMLAGDLASNFFDFDSFSTTFRDVLSVDRTDDGSGYMGFSLSKDSPPSSKVHVEKDCIHDLTNQLSVDEILRK